MSVPFFIVIIVIIVIIVMRVILRQSIFSLEQFSFFHIVGWQFAKLGLEALTEIGDTIDAHLKMRSHSSNICSRA